MLSRAIAPSIGSNYTGASQVGNPSIQPGCPVCSHCSYQMLREANVEISVAKVVKLEGD
jgi:hypothetical protein